MKKLSSENKYLYELLDKNVNNLFDLQGKLEHGIIDIDEFGNQKEILKKESIILKKQILTSLHIGKRGNVLNIPDQPNFKLKGKPYYRAYDAEKKQILGTSYEDLLDNLLAHYGYVATNYSLGAVWNNALKNYIELNPTKDKTIIAMKGDYKRVISDELANKDIRELKSDDIQKYMVNYLNNLIVRDNTGNIISKPPKSRYSALKMVFNLVYDYAISRGNYSVTVNPAKHINNKACLSLCKKPTQRRVDEVMLTEEQMDSLVNLFKERQNSKRFHGYYIPYFAAKLQRATGERPGELFALKISDVNDEYIHIHSSQIEHRMKNGEKCEWYEIVDYTKDEKGESNGGRAVPVTSEVIEILKELNEAKEKAGIISEYLLPAHDGNYCKKSVYFDAINGACKILNLPSVGSYTFRREYNCRLELAGLSPAQRASILGNSELVNTQYYTFAQFGTVLQAKQALEKNLSTKQLAIC